MRLILNTILKFTFFIFLFIGSPHYSQQNINPDSVLATIGNQRITVKDFSKRCGDYLFSTGIKDNIVIRRSILNNMVNEILLRYYDDNSKILADPEYSKELKWTEDQTILAWLEDQEVYAKITVTEAEVREAYYRANMKISARHLYAASEKEADNLYQLLQTGVDWNKLAGQVFTDSTLRNNGGYLGYFTWGDMDPAFEDAAYSLKPGEISKPVKTKNGYSIIKVEERVPHPLLTESEFINRKNHMEGVVRLRKRPGAKKAYVNKLFDQSKVVFNNKLVANIWDNIRNSGVPPESYKPKNSNGVCAGYGKKKYTQNELEKKIDQIPSFHREKINSIETLKTVLKGIILHDLLMQIAADKGYDKIDGVLNLIQKYHTVVFLEYKRKEVSENATLPDSAVKNFYKDNLRLFANPNQMNVQEIIVRTKDLADSLSFLLKQGANFGSLAEKFSARSWSARNKGIMGMAEVTKFGGLKDTLWNSEIGRVIGPQKIQDFYGIFKVLEKKPGDAKKFEDVKGDATRLAKVEQSKKIMDEYIDKLRPKVKIYFDDNLLGAITVDN